MSHGLMDFWPVGMIVKFFAKAGTRIIFHFSLARNDRQTEFGRHHAHNGIQLNAVVVHASTLQDVYKRQAQAPETLAAISAKVNNILLMILYIFCLFIFFSC